MAQGEKKFSHISVSSDEDDEFVIEAGVAAAEGSGAQTGVRTPETAGASAQVQPEASPAEREDGESGEPCAGVEPSSHAESVPGGSAAAKSAVSSTARAKDAYQPTTLEDLEGSSMSTMQKVIIGLALVGIVAAVAYYVAVLA